MSRWDKILGVALGTCLAVTIVGSLGFFIHLTVKESSHSKFSFNNEVVVSDGFYEGINGKTVFFQKRGREYLVETKMNDSKGRAITFWVEEELLKPGK